jgi:hypothetical protein
VNDEELLAALREEEVAEEAAYRAWCATPEGRAYHEVPPETVDATTARALAAMAPGAKREPLAERPKRGELASNGGGVASNDVAREGKRPAKRDVRVSIARAWGPMAAAVSAIALAAFIALRVVPAAAPPLPPYDVTIVAGAQASFRGAPSEAPALAYRAGDAFALMLRPATDVTEAVDVRAFVVAGGMSMPVTVAVHTNAAGVAQLQGRWPDGIAADPSELVVVIGRPGELPREAPRDDAPHSWRVARLAVRAARP